MMEEIKIFLYEGIFFPKWASYILYIYIYTLLRKENKKTAFYFSLYLIVKTMSLLRLLVLNIVLNA